MNIVKTIGDWMILADYGNKVDDELMTMMMMMKKKCITFI